MESAILLFAFYWSGVGLYLLYLMAVYLAVFAVTMLIQFTSYFMESSHKILKGVKN